LSDRTGAVKQLIIVVGSSHRDEPFLAKRHFYGFESLGPIVFGVFGSVFIGFLVEI
jgi:hypothetical protein